MDVKSTAKRQYQAKINKAAQGQAFLLPRPREGWVATMRQALGLSAAQLGRLMGHSRANIASLERNEAKDSATLKSMQAAAQAMGCKFVYAIVPETGEIADVLKTQAEKKARAMLTRAGTHMALEKQSLNKESHEQQVKELAADLLAAPPPDFWEAE